MSVGRVRIRHSRIPVRHPSGLYVHSSPPTVLPVHPSVVRQWLRGGEIARLIDLVLKGQGQTLVGEYSPDSKARKFIHKLPKILRRIDVLHDAVRKGDIYTTDQLLSKEPGLCLELSRDSCGLGLLHKAIIHNHVALQKWLLFNYPAIITVLDKEQRSPLHYAGGSERPEETWKRLVAGGADINSVDNEGFTPAFYMHHPRRLRPPAPDSRAAGTKRQNSLQSMILKPSTIRIWIHDKDLGRLQQILWEGLGDRLKNETSTNPLIRKFLTAVPHIMGTIKDIHSATVNNDVEQFAARTKDPIPKGILMSKDANGLTPLHKAAGLGHIEIVRQILRKSPETANLKDSLDRTPLHYAAGLKDGGDLFQFLVDNGCVDHLEDKKGNTPAYYQGKPADLDGPKLLTVIPEAPRTAHTFPPSWDWKLLGGKDPEEEPEEITPLPSPQGTIDSEDPPTASDPPTENQEHTEKEQEEEQTVSASQEEEQEEVSPRPDISEDEGVGSEVPASGEDVPSPQSDTANNEINRQRAYELVKSGDMEAMAELVLSGQGASLLGLASDNPDVQLFINNVPHYMAKIERVHKAAREGDLRGVQTALDRRKFAVARDNSTPLKPTPLHAATLFGRTSVLRYLAGRFPETMHAQDSAGRTPLHYAATLPDNGHFYSLLVTLGADKAFPDNNGRTAEEYLRNKGELTRENLLAEYQNRDVPIDMSGLNFNRYSDKGAELLREGYPIFNPEEGQYLAATLGEPLIKGLTEVAQIRPKNPVIHLAHFLLSYTKQEDLIKKRSITSSATNEEILETDGHDINDNPIQQEKGDEDGEESGKPDVDGELDNASDTGEEPAFKPTNRDEHGQSMLHFAAGRAHGRNAMLQLLQEMDGNVGLRDGLYRTPRDVAQQLDIQDNVKSIDKYVVNLAAKGEDEKLKELMVDGYDHILDAQDEDNKNITEVVAEKGSESTKKVLQAIPTFEERREKLHRAIRFGSWQATLDALREADSPRTIATAKNQQGRCSLHVAVLNQNETIAEQIAKKYPSTLRVGDNLMRTPLHYAMGVEKVEPLSRILIAAGAQRVLKDLKGRQPSYYFMNKTDIQKLQDEEESLRV